MNVIYECIYQYFMKLFSSVPSFFLFLILILVFTIQCLMIIILLVIKIISLRRNDCEVLIVRLNSASEFKEIVRICLRVKKLSIICSHDYFSPMDNY